MTVTIEYEYNQRSIMNVACDYEARVQMLTTEKYIASGRAHIHRTTYMQLHVKVLIFPKVASGEI